MWPCHEVNEGAVEENIRSGPKQHHGLCLRCLDYRLLVSKPELAPFSISSSNKHPAHPGFSSKMSSAELHWPALGNPLEPCETSWGVPRGHKSTTSPVPGRRSWRDLGLSLGWQQQSLHLHSSMAALPSLKGWKANWAWKKQTNQGRSTGSSGVCVLGRVTQSVGNEQVGAWGLSGMGSALW